jgi:hypothetical protein
MPDRDEDLATELQRWRTHGSRMKMDAMRDIRNLAQDHETAIYMLAETLILLDTTRVVELAAMGLAYQAANEPEDRPQV